MQTNFNCFFTNVTFGSPLVLTSYNIYPSLGSNYGNLFVYGGNSWNSMNLVSNPQCSCNAPVCDVCSMNSGCVASGCTYINSNTCGSTTCSVDDPFGYNNNPLCSDGVGTGPTSGYGCALQTAFTVVSTPAYVYNTFKNQGGAAYANPNPTFVPGWGQLGVGPNSVGVPYQYYTIAMCPSVLALVQLNSVSFQFTGTPPPPPLPPPARAPSSLPAEACPGLQHRWLANASNVVGNVIVDAVGGSAQANATMSANYFSASQNALTFNNINGSLPTLFANTAVNVLTGFNASFTVVAWYRVDASTTYNVSGNSPEIFNFQNSLSWLTLEFVSNWNTVGGNCTTPTACAPVWASAENGVFATCIVPSIYGAWSTYAITSNASNYRTLFFNGSYCAGYQGVALAPLMTGSLLVTGTAGSAGAVADVQVYNYVLPASAIASISTLGAVVCPALVPPPSPPLRYLRHPPPPSRREPAPGWPLLLPEPPPRSRTAEPPRLPPLAPPPPVALAPRPLHAPPPRWRAPLSPLLPPPLPRREPLPAAAPPLLPQPPPAPSPQRPLHPLHVHPPPPASL
jgi:hypothetical protein